MRHLLDLLAGSGRTLQVSWISTSGERPAGLDTLLDLERMLLRRGRRCGGDREPALFETSRASYGSPEVVIDFTTAPAKLIALPGCICARCSMATPAKTPRWPPSSQEICR